MKLPQLRAGYPAPEDLIERRARMSATWAIESLAPGITPRDAEYGGIHCLVREPANPAGTLIYFHGGGYRMGSPATWASFASRVSSATDLRVVVPDYRLAPEHPFPAALQDAVAAYEAIAGCFEQPLFAGGDSAGGGLACALTLATDSKPQGLILISPWVDLTLSNPTYDNRPNDQFFPKASARGAAELYLQGHSARDPLASPLFGELNAFPPTLIFASADECVVGEALALQAKLAEDRVSVEAHIVPAMMHVWPIIAPALPESAAAVAAIAAFTRDIAGATPAA